MSQPAALWPSPHNVFRQRPSTFIWGYYQILTATHFIYRGEMKSGVRLSTSSGTNRNQMHDLWVTSPRPYHYTTEPGKKLLTSGPLGFHSFIARNASVTSASTPTLLAKHLLEALANFKKPMDISERFQWNSMSPRMFFWRSIRALHFTMKWKVVSSSSWQRGQPESWHTGWPLSRPHEIPRLFPDFSSRGKQILPSIECLPIWSTVVVSY